MPLELTDFTVPNLETVVKALFSAHQSRGFLYRADQSLGTLHTGSDVELQPDQSITRVQWDGRSFTLNDHGTTGSMAEFFTGTGAGADLTLYIKTTTRETSIAVSASPRAGGNYITWDNLPTAFVIALNSLGARSRFIVALARTATPNDPPALTWEQQNAMVEAGEVVALSGTLNDDTDASAAIQLELTAAEGTLSAVTRDGANWSATWTAPPAAAEQNEILVSATATDSRNASTVVSRTLTVRANQAPTVSITNQGGAVAAGSVQNLIAVGVAPEPGQALTYLWEVVAGSAELANETSRRHSDRKPCRR